MTETRCSRAKGHRRAGGHHRAGGFKAVKAAESTVTNVPEVLPTGEAEEDRHMSYSHLRGTKIFVNVKCLL
jgi:hypothetical protein